MEAEGGAGVIVQLLPIAICYGEHRIGANKIGPG